MARRDIVFGIILLGTVLAAYYYFSRPETPKLEGPTLGSSVEEKLEEAFQVEIPEDIDKAELKDVTGGTSSALATRKVEDSQFTLAILADLPDPAAGTFYQAWLADADQNQSLGQLTQAKGGWLLEYSSSEDQSSLNTISITQEKILDQTPENTVLKGSF